jgi:hypothetical protein
MSNLAPSMNKPEMYLPFAGLVVIFDESVNLVTLVSIVNLSSSYLFSLHYCCESAIMYEYGTWMPDSHVHAGSPFFIQLSYWFTRVMSWFIHDASFLLVNGASAFQLSGMNPF